MGVHKSTTSAHLRKWELMAVMASWSQVSLMSCFSLKQRTARTQKVIGLRLFALVNRFNSRFQSCVRGLWVLKMGDAFENEGVRLEK
jgi:hypothetical protein